MYDEVAAFVAEKARRDPKVREIVDDVRAYEELRQSAGWYRLRRAIAGRREEFIARLTGRLLRGEIVDQREIDYQRGFFAGAEFVLDQPEKAESNLETAARQAWVMTQLLADETDDEQERPNA